MTEPIADAAGRAGWAHRVVAEAGASGAFPGDRRADSISRVADDICDVAHVTARREILKLLAALRRWRTC